DGYSTDSSLSREIRALGPAIEDVDLSEEEADVTVVEVADADDAKTSANQSPPHNGDNTSVSLELQHGSIRLLLAYMAFEKEDPPDALVRGLAKECEELKTGLVLGCDANAHHTQWGCPNNNDRGESLFDFILNSNLFLCNRGNVPTFITKACQTIIDLTLVSDSLVSAVSNWFVSDEPPESTTDPNELDITIDIFTNACNSAFKVACPIGKPRGKKKPPWWTQQLSILRSSCRGLFNRAKAGNEETNWQCYKRELASYKKALKRAKRAAWHTFCSDIEETTDAARLRKILSKTAAPLGYLQKANGSWSDSSNESLDLLLDAHFPGSQLTGRPPERIGGEGINLDLLISDRNIKWAIQSFKPYKSPGPDGITPAHIQQAGQLAINWLSKIFRTILAIGELPT
ncbi:hypothetical protein KR084_009543, partial [Drosophila pseudotakahashii]